MKKFLASFLILAVSSVNAMPPFNGFYGGISAGGSLFLSHQTVDANAVVFAGSQAPAIVVILPYDSDADPFNNAAKGAICLGYGKLCKNFYLGAELFADASHYAAELSGNSLTIFSEPPPTSNNMGSDVVAKLSPVQYGIDLRPGILISPCTLLYGRIGMVGSRLTLDSTVFTTGDYNLPNWDVASSSQNSKIVAGLRLGIGIERRISENLGLKLDYIYTNYGNISINTNVVGSASNGENVPSTPVPLDANISANAADHAVMLGLTYYFPE